MGKRQIGELQPSELVTMLIVSELAAIPMQDLDRPLLNGLLPLFTLVCFGILFTLLSMKFPIFRRILIGQQAIVICNGIIDQKVMRNLRITVNDLTEALRLQGFFNIEDIAFAIMETNGRLSVKLRDDAEPVTRGDNNIVSENSSLKRAVICDGKLQRGAFEFDKLKEETIVLELNRRKLKPADVFLMTADENKNYIIIKKEVAGPRASRICKTRNDG